MSRNTLDHTGVTNTTPIVHDGPIWTYQTGNSIWSGPAIVDGLVYVGSNDANLYCLNETTGLKVWNYTTGGSVTSSPAVTNGMVYVGSADGNVYCLNAITGDLTWNYTTGGSIDSSPAVTNGKVYVGSNDANLYCLNANTGAKIWNCTTYGPISYSSPAVVNGMVYIGDMNGNVTCLNAITGTTIWNYTTGNPIEMSAAVANGMVYIGSDDGNVYCLNAITGDLTWNYTTSGPVISSPAVIDGMVYVGSMDGNVYCLNANTGAKIWNSTLSNGISYCSPIIANGFLYIGDNGGNFFCLNATTGAKIWSYNTGATNADIETDDALANGMVFVGNDNWNLFCFPMILGSVPSAPQNLTSTTASGQVSLSWKAPSEDGNLIISGYNIYRGTSSGTEVLLTTVGANTLNYTDTNLYGGQSYYYEVSAVNLAGSSVNSSEINITTPISAPTAPLNLQATPGNNNITLTWQVPLSNGGSAITGYKIYRGTSSGNLVLLNTIGNLTNYTDSAISGNTNYFYEVSAINLAGESPKSSETNVTTPIFAPSAPISLAATPGNNNITLTWQVPSSNGGSAITGYNIYRGNSTGTETLLKTVGNVLTYMDTGLSANTTYYYKISAINSAGAGPKSSEISATTFVSSTSNSTSNSSSSHHNIDGMGIGVILSVSMVGVIATIVSVKKRLK